MRESLRALREAGDTETFEGMEPDGEMPPFITPDALISTRIDGSAHVEQKMTALGRAPHPGRAGRPVLQRRREQPRLLGRGGLPDRARRPPARPRGLRDGSLRRPLTRAGVAGDGETGPAGAGDARRRGGQRGGRGRRPRPVVGAGPGGRGGGGRAGRRGCRAGRPGCPSPRASAWSVLRLAITRPEGDYVVAANPQGYLVLLLTLVGRGRRGRHAATPGPRASPRGPGHRHLGCRR